MTDERRSWSRDETIVAFNLYCKIPFKATTRRNPLIIEVAPVIGRTPSALAMKIGNLARLDPELRERGISGLVNGSKLDEEIWNEFNENWDELAFESERILAELQGRNIVEDVAVEELILPKGTTKQVMAKTRVNQAFFRSTVLSAYDGKCCVTGLSVPQLLVASHIIPWSINEEARTDPRNGLLLNSIHDKAFDTGLITITTDYEIKISDYISNFLPSDIVKEWFVDYAGKKITLPQKFLPSKEYLKWHNENVFKA